MQRLHTRLLIFITVILLLGLIFILSLRWFSTFEALRFTAALPFLLLMPGFLITQIAFPKCDLIEKATLSVALSMLIVFLALFAVERTVGKLTPSNTFATVAAVNLGTFLLCVGWRFMSRHHRAT